MGEGVEKKFRYNDDGEPNGTAGLPIYNEIKKLNLFNAVVASVRYYGGTKLGTGGLTRAYGQSASLVLEKVETTKIFIKVEFTLNLPFDFLGEIMYIINTVSGTDIVSQDYTENGFSIKVKIPILKTDDFNHLLTEKSAGKYSIKSHLQNC